MYYIPKNILIKSLQLYFLTAFVFFSMSVKGQELKTMNDTLISKEIQLFISQSDSITMIEDLINDTFDQKKDTLLGLAYSKSFLQRGKRQESYDIQYFSSYQLAYMYYVQSDYKQAVRYAYTSVKASEKMQDTTKSINSNTLLGSTWYVLGVYDEALKSYLTAKTLSTQIQDSSYELVYLTNIANIRTKLNRFDDALKSYSTILKLIDEKEASVFNQYLDTYLSSLLGKGLCLSELGSFEEAKKTYEKGVAIAETNDMQLFKGGFYVSLGRVYYEQEDYVTSLELLTKGKELLLQHEGAQNNLCIADFYIAKNFYKQERYEEAISLLDGNFERIGDDITTDKIEEMYNLAIDISEALNDKEKQIFYFNKHRNITKIKTESKLKAKDLLFEDDIKDIVTENEKLTSEKTKSIIDRNIILISSVVVFATLLFIFFSYHKRTKLKEQKFLAIIENISAQKTTKKTQKIAKDSQVIDEKSNLILEKLEALENTNFYLSSNVTLHSTAKLLNTNTSYLSKALNAVKKQSFNQYLNKLRIDYVLVKLKEDSVFRSYTIHAISQEIGYKSATTFIKEFKNKTGINPSYYIKKIDN